MRFLVHQFLCLCLLTSLQAQDAGTYAIPKTDEGLPGAGPIRRYDWFQNLWKKKRSAWAKEVEAKQGALFFFGDSITQGWGDNIG